MRTGHPYETYAAILEQPAAFRLVVQANKDRIKELSRLIRQAKTVFLVGTGTSYHDAWAAKFILKAAIPNKPILAQTAMDFALYEDVLNEQDLVIVFSYRGNKKYSLDSLKKARSAGAPAVLIAGRQKGHKSDAADLLLETVAQEESSAHTASYTSALALIAAVAEGPVEELADILSEGLKLESDMKKESAKAKNVRKIWLVGGGPNEVTAKEIALKIKETSYVQTEGIGVEELFHGPFQSAEPEDLFILIAPEGKTKARTLELIPAIREVGASSLIISDDAPVRFYGVPRVHEAYSTLSCIIPLQLFTYYLAVQKGTNPDNFRLDDPRFVRAEKYMKL